ncbi:MAG: hypothetical protein ABSB77_26135 [Xanthobacteraceae bacterium]|jgi:hypothetical protein
MPQHFDIVLAGDKLRDDVRTVVGGTVVDDDDLVERAGLAEQRGKRGADPRRVIVVWFGAIAAKLGMVTIWRYAASSGA